MPSVLRAAYGNAYLLLCLTMFMWGGNAIAARLSVGEISPMVLTAARWLFVSTFILLFLRREIAQAWPVLRARWRFTIPMGMLGFTVFNALMYVAGHFTSAVNLTLLQGSIPVFVLIGAFAVYRTAIRPLQVVGIILTLLGVAITSSGGHLERLAQLAFNFGDILMLIACALYAGYTVGLKNRPNISGLAFFCGMALVATISSFPFLMAEMMMGKALFPTPKGWAIVAYVAIGPSFLAQMFFMRAVELIGPGRAGLFANLVPVMGAVLAVLILNEPFGWHHALSLALVLGGIFIAEKGRG